MNYNEYLKEIDRVIADGKYKDNWESLCDYGLPDWFGKSRLGIFLHWGVYSVPAFYNEWYPRWMYYKTSAVYRHHVATYGKDYDYSRFIDDFKAEKFDAAQWVKAFKDMGADFLLPVGEHHDGFKMYASELSPFNSVDMGPRRDILGELKEECDAAGLRFTVSSHFAERYFYYNGARYNGGNEIARGEKKELYGEAFVPSDVKNELSLTWYNDRKFEPTDEWCEKWLVNTCELVDKYRPEAVWFDWWVSHKAFRPYMRKFLAYYYNRSEEWGKRVCVQAKFDAIAFGQGIFDRERGQLDNVSPFIWQCETSTSYSSWGYVKNSKFKNAAQILCNFIDVVSKNGVFVLNFGPKADGTLCEEERKIISAMTAWMNVHGDIVRNSRPFRVYGEGKRHKAGSFKENIKYTHKDIRYLSGKGKLYIFALGQNPDNAYKLYSLPDDRTIANFIYGEAKVAGFPNIRVSLVQKPKYLELRLSQSIDNGGLPICIELTVD